MPTYEYECDACSHRFEELQTMTEEPLKKCPKCKKAKLRRLFGTGAGVIFKGSGFYQTDYRSESYKSAAQADQQGAKAASEKPATTGTSDTGSSGTSSAPAQGGAKSPKSGS
ncbi:MAG: zinc ribbon domain-containing protein [Gemmataceae bacterium]|nr:zinc ribbon domain-containing protein [Gemmataceae bacterium]